MKADERRIAQRLGAILAHLRHPCILRHIETFDDGDFLCIVTEFCEAGDLGALQERRQGKLLPEAQVGDWFIQLCLGLLYIHKRKVLHRDLKLVRRCAYFLVQVPCRQIKPCPELESIPNPSPTSTFATL